ncbi:MFS transporter [Romboutsia weinsteinii]|uniref:MFS transporter n=1 Tax=Romboutsia weinsteinii TaxID=2020949 RepID=A0A371J2K1_9FIRM|nr:conjugated bile salt MFS transporter [Romboutsia weinsteinii]RDY27031.1 MFS transporter [Romboutsia weinsteinii]
MSTLTNNKKKISAGWVIVMACMLIQAIPFGVASNIQPLFIHPVISDRGFSLTSFSLIFSIGTIVSAVVGPFIGMSFQKINVKLIYVVGAILSGGGFLMFSMCTELWQFYAVASVVQIGTAAISGIGVPLLISSWFDEESKGKAMGLAFAGGSIGNIFLQQLVMQSLASQGYSQSYFIFGALSLVVGVPIALLFIKMPKDASQIVRSKNNKVKSESKKTDFGYTLKEVTKLKYFWMLALGFTFVGIYVSAYSIQHAAYFQGFLKFDAITVGTIGSIFAVCSLGGNIVGGVLFDKLGVIKCLIISSVLVLISGVFLQLSGQSPVYAYIFSALKGFAIYTYMMGPAYLTGSLFGNKEYGSILGIVQLLFAVGFSSGSVLFGVFVEKFGYNTSWIIILGAVAIAYVLLIGASIGMIKLNKERANNTDNKELKEVA